MTSEYVYRRLNGGVVRISSDAVSLMRSHVQVDEDLPESGGILLGRLIAESNDVIVDHAIPPCSEDRASRFRFFRAARPANQSIHDYWERSCGACNYLGEWHTHPEDCPTPSCIDRRNWLRILKKSKLEQEFLFFIIIGRVNLRLWELRSGCKVPDLLEQDCGSDRNTGQLVSERCN